MHSVKEPTEKLLTKKEIVGVGTVASNLEDFYQVIELTMYITNDCNRSCDVHYVTLLHKKLFCFGAYCFDDGFRK